MISQRNIWKCIFNFNQTFIFLLLSSIFVILFIEKSAKKSCVSQTVVWEPCVDKRQQSVWKWTFGHRNNEALN